MRRRIHLLAAVATVSGLVLAAGVTGSPARAAFAWPHGARAALSLSFDDARASQLAEGLPVFERAGVHVTFYVVSARVRQEPEGWRRAAAAGHEIGNHTRQHPCSGNFRWARDRALETYDLARMRQELEESNAEIQTAVGVRPRTFAYPCGQSVVGRGQAARSIVPLVAELFLAGRGWLDEAPNDPAYVDLAQVYGVSMDDQEFDALGPVLDQMLDEGAWLVLGGHDVGTTPGRQVTRVETLEQLLAWAREPSRRVWVDTVAAVAAHVERARGPLPAAAPPAGGTPAQDARWIGGPTDRR